MGKLSNIRRINTILEESDKAERRGLSYLKSRHRVSTKSNIMDFGCDDCLNYNHERRMCPLVSECFGERTYSRYEPAPSPTR